MVAYRGVLQQDIIGSIIDACELAQRHSPGPACDREIDALLATVPALQGASDDESFLAAMRSSHVSILPRMAELFYAYAADDTDGAGRKVWEGLHAWGAFVGTMTQELRPMDAEINGYCFVRSVRRLKDTGEAEVRALVQNSPLVADDAEIDAGVRNLLSLLDAARAGAADDTLKGLYEDLGGGRAKGRIVRFVIERLGGDSSLYDAGTRLFGRYGIQLADMVPGARFGAVRQNNAGFIDRVDEFLAPFYDADEVQSMGIGMIANDAGGIVLCVTKRVAQAVADAFPDRKVVRCADGSVIAPSMKAGPVCGQPQP